MNDFGGIPLKREKSRRPEVFFTGVLTLVIRKDV